MKNQNLGKLPIIPEEYEETHISKIDFEKIHSEMNNLERSFINGLIRYYRPGRILEVGVSKGGGTVNILNAIADMPDSSLVSIDRLEHYYRDESILVGADVGIYSEILPINRWQLIAGKDPSEVMDLLGVRFDFAVIDTTHSLPGEALTFLCILPYLNDGAIVVLHDLSNFVFVNKKNQVAPRVLFSALVGEKLLPKSKSELNEQEVDNIGAVQINSDTIKHIGNVFQALAMPWSYYHEEDINNIRLLLGKHYNSAMMGSFEEAVKNNLILLNPLARVKTPSTSLHTLSKNIVFYGGGENMKTLINAFDTCGIQFDYPIWDINANKISDINGHKVIAPDFHSKVSNTAVIITIDDQEIARSVAEKLVSIGFVVIKSKEKFIDFFITNYLE